MSRFSSAKLNILKFGLFYLLLRLSLVSSTTVFTNISSTTDNIYPNFIPKARMDAFQITTPKKDPYAVLIAGIEKDTHLICSGTLITLQWVLTAAHCLYGEDRIRGFSVFAGGMNGQDLLDKKLPEHGQMLKGAKSCVHPKYLRTGHANDIALIKLHNKFKTSDFVKTISFATRPCPQGLLAACKVTGFGVVQLNSEHSKDNWRKTQDLLVSKTCPCEDLLTLMFSNSVVNSWICNRPKEDYGLCPGDSGGGLVCGGEVKGIASIIVEAKDLNTCKFGMDTDEFAKCGTKDTLSIFIDVGSHSQWVQSHINSKSVSGCVDMTSRSVPNIFLVLFLPIHLLIL